MLKRMGRVLFSQKPVEVACKDFPTVETAVIRLLIRD